MITPESLAIYRCPIDPTRTAMLVLDDTRILCEQCRVQFRTREGFPSFLTDEATLPEGCPSINRLPCQQARRDRNA